jgi:dUTP pyrophosphatase
MSLKEDKKLAQQKVNEHLRILKKQAFQIDVQVLNVGDSYKTITAEGETEVVVDASGKLPAKKNYTDAGFDLYTPYNVDIVPGQIVKIPLNIRMKLPTGSWARIETKSGLGSRGMLVYAGVVDQDYRGIPHVIATNLNHLDNKIIHIPAGTKIAQMTMNPHSLEFYVNQVDSVDTATARGQGGFGSTGVV